MLPHVCRASAVFVVAVAGLTVGATSASAEPGDPVPVVLTAQNLGLPDVVNLWNITDSATLSVAVADGIRPTALDVGVELAPGVTRGSIDVVAQNRLLARLNLPLTPDERLSLPLVGVPVVDGHATFEVRTRVFTDGECLLDRFTPAVRLVDQRVIYDGVETQPTTVADFLPPVLQKLSIYVPPTPTRPETQAALQLATDVIAHYRHQPVLIETRPLPGGQVVADHASGPLERQIAVTEGADTFVELRSDGPAPLLRIAGHGTQLTNQVRLITNDLARLAVTPRAASGELAAQPQIAPTHTTLQDLGELNLSATAPIHATVDIGLDQARLGRLVGNVVLDLRGSYTPLPSTQSGRIVVSVANRELDSWPAASDGHFARSITIPDNLLGRFTTVSVRFDQTGPSSGCGLDSPITLDIDPSSDVHTEAATAPHPGGFAALPQGLMPRVDVGLLDGGFDDTRRAISLISGLQRLSEAPLLTQVVDFTAAASGSSPAVLIAANGGIPASVALPLAQVEVSKLRVLTAEGSTDLEVFPGIAFGSLQAAWSGDRMVLAATSTRSPQLLDEILRQLDSDPTMWNRLSGDVAFQALGRPLEMLSLADTSKAAQSTSKPSNIVRNLVATAGVLAGLGAIGAVFVFVRRRRSTG